VEARRVVLGGGRPLLAIVLLAAALRFATLDVQSFSDDELFTVWLARMPLSEMVSTVPNTEATPHLFYLLEWLFVHAFGSSEVAVRLLPAICGVLTVPLVYAAGAIGASRRVGLAAALFAAVNPFLIWYSQEARAYALLILLVALSLTFLAAHMRSGGSGALAGWAVTAALALATHYFAVFVVAPEAVWLLMSQRGSIRQRAIAVAVPVIAGLALLPLALHQRDTVGDPGGLGDLGFAQRVGAVPKNFLVGFSIPAEALLVAVAAAASAVALVLAARSSRGDERRGAWLAASLAAASLLIPLALAPLGFDYVSSRNLVATLVPVAIVLGCGFAQGTWGRAALAVACAVSIVTVIAVDASPEYQRRDWRGASEALGRPRAERLLVFNPPFHNPGPFGVYFGPTSRSLASAAQPVSEVDVVALAESRGFGPDTPRPPLGAPPAPPRGFHRVQDVTTSSYRVVRFMAPRPLPVARDDLVGFPGIASVLVAQRP
jgi:hypothetical protein